MKIAWVILHPQTLEYLWTAFDGHVSSWIYSARYYSVHLFVRCHTVHGQFERDGYIIHCFQDDAALLDAVVAFQPDACVAYGPCGEPPWQTLKQRLPPVTFFALDYAGGPLTGINGEKHPALDLFDHVLVAHDTQARLLRSLGVPASKARGVPTSFFRPMPEVPKHWGLFCPTTFVPGKRPTIAAQWAEQYAPEKPSLFAGAFEVPAVVDMVRQGGIPLNKSATGLSAGPHRSKVVLAGRIPSALMPATYNAAEFVVSCSGEEAGPWTVMEALACGVPTIVMSDAEWAVADQFRTFADVYGLAVQVVDPMPDCIGDAMERARGEYAKWSRNARLVAYRHYNFWTQYDVTDRVLKNGTALKQAGQRVA